MNRAQAKDSRTDTLLQLSLFFRRSMMSPYGGISSQHHRQGTRTQNWWQRQKTSMALKNRRALVTDAASFTEAVNTSNVIEMTSSDTDGRNKSLNISEVFTNAPAVSGITSSHHMRVISERCSHLSPDKGFCFPSHRESNGRRC